ncbi:hypothetical protein [Fredinandcohnia onubensis]|uniref:hypothetical protein n=1 Tax=Fredinandcohnia onubensis TaxID=1571209 RepID=UPI000C0C0DF6|nr:hypothetical protein [Fredinandcohnia onubensis]
MSRESWVKDACFKAACPAGVVWRYKLEGKISKHAPQELFSGTSSKEKRVSMHRKNFSRTSQMKKRLSKYRESSLAVHARRGKRVSMSRKNSLAVQARRKKEQAGPARIV